MIFINKRSVPIWLTRLLKNDLSIKEYRDLSAENRKKLRQDLVDEQLYLCGYCCGKANESSAHNEHIKPQEMCTDKESLDYYNIIASCRGFHVNSETCGHRKNNAYDETMFVSPLVQGCEQNFKYTINGEIVGLNERAKYTIALLNLNSGALKNARKGILKQSRLLDCATASEIYEKPYMGKMQPFCNIVKYFLNNHSHLFSGTKST